MQLMTKLYFSLFGLFIAQATILVVGSLAPGNLDHRVSYRFLYLNECAFNLSADRATFWLLCCTPAQIESFCYWLFSRLDFALTCSPKFEQGVPQYLPYYQLREAILIIQTNSSISHYIYQYLKSEAQHKGARCNQSTTLFDISNSKVFEHAMVQLSTNSKKNF